MIHIDNLNEKELLIAHYFSENTKKELNPHEVFDMWSNWFKKDFRINNQPVFCVVDNELVYRKSVKKKDESLGFAIYAVSGSSIEQSTWTQISTAKLGSSNSVQKGDAVAVLGKPFGYAGAVGFGTIANSRNELDADDGSYQLLCTDIGAAEDGTGVIVNLSGEVVGIIDQSISDNSSKRLVTGYGISGLKSEIELLSNGQAVPYVGIRGLDVTAEIEAQGIPNGVYVQTVEPDSPAMAAGIQSGDIITEAAGKKISSLAVYQSVMRDQKSGSKIRLKGQRQGSGGYVDISFDVTVGSKE